jgi:signal transduction histidine kinase
MGFLLVLPILVSGYIFCNGSVYRQATINKYEGQLLYLLVAKIGLFVFICASVLSFLLVYFSKHAYFGCFSFDYLKYAKAFLVRNGIAKVESASLWAFLGQASLISFILAWCCPRAYVLAIRWRHSLSTDQAKAFIQNYDVPNRPITKQLLASMVDATGQYMFSMDDRKVYVGRVSSVGEPHETAGLDEDFEIVPTMSGYRDKDTLKVTYTTDYSAVVETMEQAGRSIGFTILLSQKNIVSMSRFEFSVWEQFKAKQDSQTTSLDELA